MGCNCNDNTIPQPCCAECPDTNPCENGCLDYIDASCIEFTSDIPNCLSITDGSKLDFIIGAIDNEICSLKQGGDKLVRTSAVDTTSGYLYDKITTCSYLTSQIVTASGQQKLQLCLNLTNLVSPSETNALFVDVDGVNINYTVLIDTIINDPALMTALCNAIAAC